MPTYLTDDRATALRVGYDATEWASEVSFADYENALADWFVALVVKNGEPVGAVFLRDDELHFSILPKWRKRWITKEFVKEFFSGRRFVTRVTPEHDYMVKVLERLGFRQQDNGLLVKEADHGY